MANEPIRGISENYEGGLRALGYQPQDIPVEEKPEQQPAKMPSDKQRGVEPSPEDVIGRGRTILGMEEHRDRKELKQKIGVDVAAEPWCADFVNWTLKQNGLPTSGGRSVASFKEYGAPVPSASAAKQGDIVLQFLPEDGEQHAAIYLGPAPPFKDNDGTLVPRIRVLSGNWSDQVKEHTMYLGLGGNTFFRRPPYKMRWAPPLSDDGAQALQAEVH